MRVVDAGGDAPYRIVIAANLLTDGPALAACMRGRHALVVSDSNVAPLHGGVVVAALRTARPILV